MLVQQEAKSLHLKIVVDDVEYYSGVNLDMHSNLWAGSGNFSDGAGTPVNTTLANIEADFNNYVFPVAIAIGPDIRVSIQLKHGGALTAISGNFCAILKGEIIRAVA